MRKKRQARSRKNKHAHAHALSLLLTSRDSKNALGMLLFVNVPRPGLSVALQKKLIRGKVLEGEGGSEGRGSTASIGSRKDITARLCRQDTLRLNFPQTEAV